MFSTPLACRPKKIRSAGTRINRAMKYATGLMPFSRASRCASSWVSSSIGRSWQRSGRLGTLCGAPSLERLPTPATEDSGDEDVHHDQDRVRDVVAGRAVLGGVDHRLGEPCVGEHVPDGDGDQEDGVLAFELHGGRLRVGWSPTCWCSPRWASKPTSPQR